MAFRHRDFAEARAMAEGIARAGPGDHLVATTVQDLRDCATDEADATHRAELEAVIDELLHIMTDGRR
jgi:hypothetical protein